MKVYSITTKQNYENAQNTQKSFTRYKKVHLKIKNKKTKKKQPNISKRITDTK